MPGFLSCGSYNGGGEGFTTYRLSVVMRQPVYARIAVTTLGWLLAIELGDRLVDSTRWGIKKEKKKKRNETKAGQEQRAAIDCITEAVDGSAIVSTPPAERNWANTTDTTIIDVTSRRG